MCIFCDDFVPLSSLPYCLLASQGLFRQVAADLAQILSTLDDHLKVPVAIEPSVSRFLWHI
jgi:hypothetical protein